MKVDESQESQNKVGYITKYSQSKIVSFTTKKVVLDFSRDMPINFRTEIHDHNIVYNYPKHRKLS